MSNGNWLKYAGIPAAFVALMALAGMARPVVISDAPPWSGVLRVERMSLTGQIRGTWRDYCRELRAGNVVLSDTYNAALNDLLDDYRLLTGAQFTLRPC